MAATFARFVLRTGCQSPILRLQAVSTPRITSYIVTRLSSTATRPGLYYSKDHEWLKQDGDVATIGITDHAQDLLGDVVYCELPEVGTEVECDEACGSIESVKAVSDIMSPVTGEVTEVNATLTDTPANINKHPYEAGWLFKLKMKDTNELGNLMTEEDYKKFLETQE